MKNFFLLRWVVLTCIGISWTSALPAQPRDSILTYQMFLENIRRFHPMARQAELKWQEGEAENLRARGYIDPEWKSGWEQKDFGDQLYYRKFQTVLRVPTPLGLDVVGGYEQTRGVYVNPEDATGAAGLLHLGLEADLLQGLLVNERQTALRQAKVMLDLTRSERQVMLNDLVYQASRAYLAWQQYTFYDEVWRENVGIAQVYFDNTKLSFFNGESTAMDTLEAFIGLQEAITQQQRNEMDLMRSRMYVENHLWWNELPAELFDWTRPEPMQNQLWPEDLLPPDTTLTSNPMIMASLSKIALMEIGQRLKRESLKPRLTLKYNPLLAADGARGFSVNDYRVGVMLAMPILWKTERAEVQLGDLKIREAGLELDFKRNEWRNKIQNSWDQQRFLQDQVVLLEQNVRNYRQLLEGETEKFRLGESSVFLLNRRQEKYIEAQMKWIGTYMRRQGEILDLLYYSNALIRE